MDSGDLSHLEALHLAATPGEWRSTWDEPEPRARGEFGEETIIEAVGQPDPEVVGLFWYDGMHAGCSRENAALIAATRNALPTLLEAARTAERLTVQVSELQRDSGALRAVRMLLGLPTGAGPDDVVAAVERVTGRRWADGGVVDHRDPEPFDMFASSLMPHDPEGTKRAWRKWAVSVGAVESKNVPSGHQAPANGGPEGDPPECATCADRRWRDV